MQAAVEGGGQAIVPPLGVRWGVERGCKLGQLVDGVKATRYLTKGRLWSARTWTSFNVQKLSVAVQRSVALETAHALGLTTAVDPRAADAA